MKLAVFFVALVGCGPSAVHTQALAAHALARTWNGVVIPGIEAAYRNDQRNALDAACPVSCSEEVSGPALQRVRARWANFWAASEVLRLVHDAYREELARCQERSATVETCGASFDLVLVRFGESVPALRCAIRETGHIELDPWGESGASCGQY